MLTAVSKKVDRDWMVDLAAKSEHNRVSGDFPHYRHLIDEQKCTQTEHRYGPITGKFVLYRGESQVVEGIQYQNVEEYLNSLTS